MIHHTEDMNNRFVYDYPGISRTMHVFKPHRIRVLKNIKSKDLCRHSIKAYDLKKDQEYDMINMGGALKVGSFNPSGCGVHVLPSLFSNFQENVDYVFV